MLAQLFVILSFAAVGLARTASTNDTDCPINIPGFTHNGDCELFCKPATWKDIIVFYLANYVAHVATVVTEPGESPLTSIISLALVLFFPGAGIVKGALAISSGAVFASTELRQAARAGALCVVVKDEIPETNEIREEPFDLVDHPMNRRPRTPSVDLERHGLTANGLQTLKPRGGKFPEVQHFPTKAELTSMKSKRRCSRRNYTADASCHKATAYLGYRGVSNRTSRATQQTKRLK